jgi:hypothetical protein
MLAGRSCVGESTTLDASHLPVQIAGDINGFYPYRHNDRRVPALSLHQPAEAWVSSTGRAHRIQDADAPRLQPTRHFP